MRSIVPSTGAQALSRGSFLAAAGAAGAAASLPLPSPAMEMPTNARLKELLEIDPKHAGKGLTLDCGVVFPLTGFGAMYGTHMMELPRAVASQIKQLGGPTFNLVPKDNHSGDPDAGVTAARELGAAHVGMELTSYAADLGAMTPGIKRYKIFSLDGSGGTALFAEHKPYFWGTIAKTPNDAFPGLAKYLAAKMPDVKKIGSCGWDLGPLTDTTLEDAKKIWTKYGMTLVADERTAVSETDYSPNIQKLKAADPDIIFCAMYTEDPGYFVKQYRLAGGTKPVVMFAHTQAAQEVAGAAYDGVIFAFDYFDWQHPSNPWCNFYVTMFNKFAPKGFIPDAYGANTYEDFFILWECVRRVIKKGGNPKDGAQLDAALREKPIFKSLYGGSANELGTLEFDLDTHSVKRRPLRVMQWSGGKMKTLAYFNIGGNDFRLA